MKKTVNFRFDERVLEALARLSVEWSCTRTAVLERLVLEAEKK